MLDPVSSHLERMLTIDPDPTGPTQFGHTCLTTGRHMFSTGGDNGGYPTPLFYIFDLVELSWTNSYNPGADPYEVPGAISAVVGGKYGKWFIFSLPAQIRHSESAPVDLTTLTPCLAGLNLLIYCITYSSTGGATGKAPKSGWTTSQLAGIFSTTPTNSSTTTPTAASNKQPTPANKTGVIAGATVGGVIGILIAIWIGYCIFQCWKRHHRGGQQNQATGPPNEETSGTLEQGTSAPPIELSQSDKEKLDTILGKGSRV